MTREQSDETERAAETLEQIKAEALPINESLLLGSLKRTCDRPAAGVPCYACGKPSVFHSFKQLLIAALCGQSSPSLSVAQAKEAFDAQIDKDLDHYAGKLAKKAFRQALAALVSAPQPPVPIEQRRQAFEAGWDAMAAAVTSMQSVPRTKSDAFAAYQAQQKGEITQPPAAPSSDRETA